MVEVGTGTKGTRYLNKNYPNTDGLTAGTTKQTGHISNLVATKGSLIPRRLKTGL